MALSKDITLQNGVTCNYHRITQLNLEIRETEDLITDEEGNEKVEIKTVNILTFRLSHYVSQDIRMSVLRSSIKVDRFGIGLSEEGTEKNLRQVAYDYLKTLDEYKDATDC